TNFRNATLERGAAPGPGPMMKLTAEDIDRAAYLRDVKHLAMSEVAERLGVSVATLYRRLPPRSTAETDARRRPAGFTFPKPGPLPEVAPGRAPRRERWAA